MTDLSITALRQSKTLRTIVAFAGGNLVATILNVAGSLIQGRYVPPEDMGVFKVFGIVLGYMTFLHLGVFDGLQREIPLQIGRGDPEKARRAASACLAWIVTISAATAALFLGLAVRAALQGDMKQFWGWMAYAPLGIATFYGGYLGTTYRTGQQFVTLSKTGVLQAIGATLILPLLPWLGYFAVCLRAGVGSFVGLFFRHVWRPMRVRPRFDLAMFREVVHIGLPLSAIGYLSTSLWLSVEGTFVGLWFGAKVLGLYGYASFVRVLAVQMAMNMNQVISVRVYEQFGRTGRATDCLRLVIPATGVAVVASIPLVIVGWFVLPLAVELLIPKYVEGISMMRIALLAMPVTFLTLPVTILWAAARRLDGFIGVAAGLGTFTGLSAILHIYGFGAVSVLSASILGQLVTVLVSYAQVLRLVVRERHETMAGVSEAASPPCEEEFGTEIQNEAI